MAGGTNANDRFTGGNMFANGLHHRLGRRATAGADDEQIGLWDDLPILEIVILHVRRCGDVADLVTTPGQFLPRELGECFPGVILVLANDERDVFLDVALESEGFATEEVCAGDARAPIFLDVLDDQSGAAEMRDPRTVTMIIHGVGHVAQGQNVLLMRDMTERSDLAPPSAGWRRGGPART